MSEQTPGPFDVARAAGDLWKSDLSSAVARVFKWVLTIGIVGVVGAGWLGAWRYSDAILRNTLTPDPNAAIALLDDGSIVEVLGDAISLAPTEQASALGRDGFFGLSFSGGSGIVGPLLSGGQDGSVVARRWTPVEGTPTVGMRVGIDRDTYLRDPLVDKGIEFSEVTIPSPGIGDLPAWYVAGDLSTWVIIIHDIGRGLTESLRTLPLFAERGFPVLAISYRNDPGVVGDEGASVGYGLTEWQDLQAAVVWARSNGAKKFVLVGYGLGGGIGIEFMASSPFAEDVAGLMLDAPVLDLGVAIDSVQGVADIPQILRSLAKTIATFRFGVNWSELDYIEKFDVVTVPVMLTHGVEDEVVPVELSDELAERYATRLTYLRVEGAGHGESWNVATAEYESAVDLFLTEVITELSESGQKAQKAASEYSEVSP